MKKSKIIISLILVIVIFMETFVYAQKEQTQNKVKAFISVDKEEATIGDIVTMTLDLTKIDYDEFVLTIQADKKILDSSEVNVQTESKTENNETIIKKENDLTMKLFANKQNLSSNEIKLCFIIPETLNVGDKINLYSTIEEVKVENSDNENTTAEESEELLDDNTKQNSKVEKNIEETTMTITIKEENKQNSNHAETDKNTTNTEKSKKESNTIETTEKNSEKTSKEKEETKTTSNSLANSEKSKTSSNSSNSTSSNKSKTTSSNAEETYKGSSDKYLTNIEVEGYKLTPNFNITNTTYFLEVESNVTTLNITTSKYDSQEKVTIYGNENLKTGTNKILINVTAQDGTTKTYRLYVTKK